MSYDAALVIGAGAFGTSMACVLGQNFKKVILKVRSQDVYDSVNAGENSVYLPGQKLPSNIKACLSFEEVRKEVGKLKIQLVVNGLPTSALRSYYQDNFSVFKEFFEQQVPFVSLSKGIDPDTLELPDDLLNDSYASYSEFITYLSGPSFAREIVDEQVTIVSLAGKSPTTLLSVSEMLSTHYFKAFPTYDIKGVLLGGSLKNILAIAGGMLEGLGYNHNTRAAMITRGITEMLRFGKVFNARPETFYSFSGMGDLILTTTSSLSRNKTFGEKIAKGASPKELIESQRSVVEGYKTTLAAHKLAEKYQIRTRIFEGLYQVLYKGVNPKDVIKQLMEIPVSSID